jgi:hypothetical protein
LFQQQNIDDFQTICKFFFNTYGTEQPCNRFDVGNGIELAIAEMLQDGGVFQVDKLPNAKRYDLCIKDFGSISIKYSSSGNIRLHNSLGENKDHTMKDTLLVTPTEILFLHIQTIEDMGIDVSSYMKNTKDALELKRSILTELTKAKYQYSRKIDIICNKKDCLSHRCAEVVYEDAKRRLGMNKKTDDKAVQTDELPDISLLNIADD